MHPVLLQLLYSGWRVEVTLLEKGKLKATGTHVNRPELVVTDQIKGFEILDDTYHDIFWSRFSRSCKTALKPGPVDSVTYEYTSDLTL